MTPTPGARKGATPAFAASLLFLLLNLASTTTTARAQVIGGCPTVEGCASCVPRVKKLSAPSPALASPPPPPPPARFELSKTAIDSYLNSLLDRVFDGVDKAAEAPGGMVGIGVSAATAADMKCLACLPGWLSNSDGGCDEAPKGESIRAIVKKQVGGVALAQQPLAIDLNVALPTIVTPFFEKPMLPALGSSHVIVPAGALVAADAALAELAKPLAGAQLQAGGALLAATALLSKLPKAAVTGGGGLLSTAGGVYNLTAANASSITVSIVHNANGTETQTVKIVPAGAQIGGGGKAGKSPPPTAVGGALKRSPPPAAAGVRRSPPPAAGVRRSPPPAAGVRRSPPPAAGVRRSPPPATAARVG